MATLTEIEKLTETYAERRMELAETVNLLHQQLEDAKKALIGRIRRDVAAAKDAEAALRAAIEAGKDLFDKPRTRTFNGVKVGYAKSKGSIAWDDEDAVIKRIRKLLPADQAELLIRVEESVHKPGVYDLTAGDLKRLGIEIEGAGDAVVIKDTASQVDKLVAALLKDREGEPA